MIKFCVGLVIALVVGVVCDFARADITLSRGDEVAILRPEGATPTQLFAADEVSRYLAQAVGIRPVAQATASTRLTIDLNRKAPLEARLAGVDPTLRNDSFVVRVHGDRVELIGGSDRGTLYAAYELLEQLGCRWVYPGVDIVPTSDQWVIKAQDRLFTPAFALRHVDGDSPSDATVEQMIDWLAKNRFNQRFNLRPERLVHRFPNDPALAAAWQKRGGVLQWQWTAHNLSAMFPVNDREWLAQHADYFALYSGRRVLPGSEGRPGYGGGNVCTTNAKVIDHVANWINTWFDKHPDGFAVPVWPSDGAVKWCECTNCSALGGRNFVNGPEGSMSRRLVTFVNAVAREVAKRHPDKFLVLPAYTNYVDPVPGLAIEANVIVQHVHHGNLGQPVSHPDNAHDAKRMLGWSKAAPNRMAIWELGLIGDHLAVGRQNTIFPLLRRYQLTLSWLHDNGFRYYYSQGVAAYHQSNGLLYWCLGKLMWNPKADLREMIEDHCRAAYGDAGPLVAQALDRLDRSAAESAWYPRSYSDVAAPSPAVYTPEVISEGSRLLEQAGAVHTLDADQRTRLNALRDVFRASAAAVSMQLEAGLDEKQPWRLARGEDVYVMNADGANLPAKRFDDLVRTMQDQGRFDESFKRTIFRARKRDEPVVTVETDRLKVSALPGVGGRLLRIIDKKSGHNFLQERPNGSRDSLAHAGDAYFAYGGLEEYVGRGFAGAGWEIPFKSVTREIANGKAIELTAEFELPDGRVRLTRTIELLDEPTKPATVRVRSELTNLENVPRKLSLRSHPLMTLDDSSLDDEIYFRTRSGNTHSSARVNHDGPLTQPDGLWAAYSPSKGRGIIQAFDQASASAYFFCDSQSGYFNMELFGVAREVGQGQAVVLEQTLTPLPDPATAAEAMKQAFGEDVAVPDPTSQPASTRDVEAGGKAPAIVDGAAVFRGEEVLIYDDPAVGIDTAEGTLSLWTKPAPEKRLGAHFILSLAQNAGNWMYLVLEPVKDRDSATKVSILFSRGTKPFDKPGQFYTRISAELPPPTREDGWRLITVRWIGGEPKQAKMEVLIDGKRMEGAENLTLQPPGIDGPLYVGGNGGQAEGRFVGSLAGVTVNAKQLTDDAIAARFAAGPRAAVADRNEVLSLPLDRDTRATVRPR